MTAVGEHLHRGAMRKQTRHSGRFDYRVSLPEHVDGKKIDAKLADGVTVRIPKSERSERHEIEVES